METVKVTAQLIMETLKKWVEEHEPIPEQKWIDYALKLNMILGEDENELAELDQKYHQLIDFYMQDQQKLNATAAKIKAKTQPIYVEFRKKQMFVDRAREMIMLAKRKAKASEFN